MPRRLLGRVAFAAGLLTLACSPSAVAAGLPADVSFGTGGSVLADLGASVRPSTTPTTVEAADGDLVTVLTTTEDVLRRAEARPATGLRLVRHDAWGTRATSFGTNGEVVVPGLNGDVLDARILADGRVAVIGGGWGDLWLVHVAPDGTVRQNDAPVGDECFGPLDGTVGADGTALAAVSCQAAEAWRLAIGAELQRIPLAGTGDVTPQTVIEDATGGLLVPFQDWGTRTTRVRRYTAAGAADEAYGDVQLPGDYGDAALDPEGRLVVSGYSGGGYVWRVARLEADGDLDPGFADGGLGAYSEGMLGITGSEQQVHTQQDGRILVTGLLESASGNGLAVLRLTEAGAYDETFAPGGVMDFDPARRIVGQGVFGQADGNVVVALVFRADDGSARAAVPALPSTNAHLALLRYGTAVRPRPGDQPAAETTPEAATQQQPPSQQQAPPAPSVQTTIPSTTPKVRRTCLSRRSFTIRLRPKGRRFVRAVVKVAGRRVPTRIRRGRRVATVDLRKLPQATFRVTIAATDAKGRVVRETRRYRTCRVGQNGPKVRGGSTVITVG